MMKQPSRQLCLVPKCEMVRSGADTICEATELQCLSSSQIPAVCLETELQQPRQTRRRHSFPAGSTQAKLEASDTVDFFESMDDNTESIVQLELEM